MVVDGSEDFLRRDEEGCHLPYSKFEVHLRKFEQSSRRVSARAVYSTDHQLVSFWSRRNVVTDILGILSPGSYTS